MPQFSIITPSFHGAQWLPLALASVADQEGVTVEHLVQDACSEDGTAEILATHPKVRAFIEKDDGMYDALNRGLRRAEGEILAWLNCDEQYLPGALLRVAEFFEKHPEADFVVSGLVVVNNAGEYICSRKVLPPLALHTRVCHLSAFSCGLFFRRRVIDQHGLYFNPEWKAVGDAEWVLRAIDQGMVFQGLPGLTSVFTDTGENLGGTDHSERERDRLRDTAPFWQRKIIPLVAAHHRLRRYFGGIYHQKPFEYAIYTQAEPARRTRFAVPHPTALWRDRLTLLR